LWEYGPTPAAPAGLTPLADAQETEPVKEWDEDFPALAKSRWA
jgi:hypothetical protein